jgi:hypothetical protein
MIRIGIAVVLLTASGFARTVTVAAVAPSSVSASARWPSGTIGFVESGALGDGSA